ncbi:MAG: FAD-dependent oxidoreductase [Candidatus Obscuribacterales bacterium]|nr:FAD-dependent oxidoreductase [Candidatus Obscuribacterales bacterium]
MIEREASLEAVLKQEEFDLLVIGAGIVGANIAQIASLMGKNVLIIDKGDFASGSSSKNSPMLRSGIPTIDELKLPHSKKAQQDKERLKLMLPHLLKDESFVLPFSENKTFFNIKATIGLTAHEILSSSALEKQNSLLSKKDLANLIPALSTNKVSGGLRFHEKLFDETRVVLSLLKSAAKQGAVLVNYLEAKGFELESGKIQKVHLHDRYSGRDLEIKCRFCINAAGVQAKQVAALAGEKIKEQNIIKRSYLVLKASAFETNSALFLPGTDGRMVFILPYQHALLLGDCKSKFESEDLDNPQPEAEEIDYLLSAVNNYTDSRKLSTKDIQAAFSSLHLESENKAQSQDCIIRSNSGLITVCGLKSANCRSLIEALLKEIFPGTKAIETDQIIGWANKEDYIAESAAIEIRARKLGLEPASIKHLIANYAKEAEQVLDLIEKKVALKERIVAEFPPLYAELPFALINEMAISLQDFMMRRTRLAYLNQKLAMQAAEKTSFLMAEILGWDEQRRKLEIEAMQAQLFQISDMPKSKTL